MHKKYNKFLIVSFIAVSIFGIYTYFYNDLIKSEAADETGSLTSSLGGTGVATTVSGTGKAEADTAFLQKLTSLKKIKIDTSLFTEQSFTTLVDNSVELGQPIYGRINPFSPLSNMANRVNTNVVDGLNVVNTN